MRRSARIRLPRAPRAIAAAGTLVMSVLMTGCEWPRPPEVTIPPTVTWNTDASAGTYRVPVDGVVVDPFRTPDHPYGPGNRGIEYGTDPGTTVWAAQAGTVGFAGHVGGRQVVAIQHADGRRSTYTGLADLEVERGDDVAAGQRIGSAGSTLHFGVKDGAEYVDPALVFGPPEVVLVPDPATG